MHSPRDDEALRISAELLAMAREDLDTRALLAGDGSLYAGYHPAMRAVHECNASRLLAILEIHGWPCQSLVGEAPARAAWLVLQHAIGSPALQRRGLALLRDAAARQEVPAWQVAMLEDRILVFEGREQRFGTQFDWDPQGQLSPLPIEDAANVDARRHEVGLASLAEDIEAKRAAAARDGERRPADWARREQEKLQWLQSAGWRD